MSGRPGRLGAAVHDFGHVREFGSKLMDVPETAVMAGHAHRGDWWRIVWFGPVLRIDAQEELCVEAGDFWRVGLDGVESAKTWVFR
jgi:hypothetical protein